MSKAIENLKAYVEAITPGEGYRRPDNELLISYNGNRITAGDLRGVLAVLHLNCLLERAPEMSTQGDVPENPSYATLDDGTVINRRIIHDGICYDYLDDVGCYKREGPLGACSLVSVERLHEISGGQFGKINARQFFEDAFRLSRSIKNVQDNEER